jgi:hypothetical protein
VSDALQNLLLNSILGDEAPELEGDMPTPRAHRRMAKRRMMDMDRETHLSQVMGAAPAAGESVHIVSGGKFDFWTWVPVMLDWIKCTDALYCSTWTLSRPNALDLFAVHDAGQVAKGQIHFLTGLYFKRRETAVFNLLLDGITSRGGRYRAFENHAKVLLLSNAASGIWIVVEGSANLNANPRMEQYVLTNDKELHAFHRNWMDEEFNGTAKKRPPKKSKGPRNSIGFSCRRAGLGVMASRNDPASRKELIRQKLATIPSDSYPDVVAGEIVLLIQEWAPNLPPGTVVTVPPQGASWPGDYLAEKIGRSVAGQLGIPFETLLTRNDTKRHHHPMASLAQEPFTAGRTTAGTVIVVDDLLTSGNTMKLSLAALRDAGVAAFGFAYNGS